MFRTTNEKVIHTEYVRKNCPPECDGLSQRSLWGLYHAIPQFQTHPNWTIVGSMSCFIPMIRIIIPRISHESHWNSHFFWGWRNHVQVDPGWNIMNKLKNIIGPRPPPQGAPYAVLFSWTLGGIGFPGFLVWSKNGRFMAARLPTLIEY